METRPQGGPGFAVQLDVRRRFSVPVAADSGGHGGHHSSRAPAVRPTTPEVDVEAAVVDDGIHPVRVCETVLPIHPTGVVEIGGDGYDARRGWDPVTGRGRPPRG